MNSTIKSALLALAVISLAAACWLHHHAAKLAQEKNLAIRQLGEQISALLAEPPSSSNQPTARSFTNNLLNDLAQLRQQVGALRQKTNDLGLQIKSNLPTRAQPLARKEAPHTEEYWKQLHELAGGRTRDGVALGMGSLEYASEHHGHFPTSTEQVASYIQQAGGTLSGTNQFEYIYQGTLADLAGIPTAAVAVMRDRQTWTAPSGKLARVYVLADGVAQIVESDDDFKGWEAQHVLPAGPTER